MTDTPSPDTPTTSQTVPTKAKCVIIGAGIVGNCLVGHLSRLGWTDMVQIDKGPLPNPGGSTGHASNFIFPTDHNKEMAFLTLESQRQYIDHGLNNTCGGIEVARKPERMEEFKRRMTSAKAWGIDSRLVTPAEIKELVPFINEEILLGGFYTPSVSVRRLAGDRHADAQRGCRRRRTAGVRQHRGARRRDRGRPRRTEGRGGRHQQGSHRGRVRRHRLRRVEPAHRHDGRRQHPAHAGRAPDGRRRPDRHPRSRAARRSPTRSFATWTRSATSARPPARWRSAPTPTVRSSCTPTTSRRSRNRHCRRPSCRSRPTTSTSSSKRRSS